jgi:hypothetical protein
LAASRLRLTVLARLLLSGIPLTALSRLTARLSGIPLTALARLTARLSRIPLTTLSRLTARLSGILLTALTRTLPGLVLLFTALLLLLAFVSILLVHHFLHGHHRKRAFDTETLNRSTALAAVTWGRQGRSPRD